MIPRLAKSERRQILRFAIAALHQVHGSAAPMTLRVARASATANTLPSLPLLADAPLVSHALFRIGDKVKHRIFGFRGVVFDVDPVFANSEEWY